MENEKIMQEITELQQEHRTLDSMIARTGSMDMLKVARMKKRKLWLKDEIARLSGFLHPDIIA